jgi:hypothetical protein
LIFSSLNPSWSLIFFPYPTPYISSIVTLDSLP